MSHEILKDINKIKTTNNLNSKSLETYFRLFSMDAVFGRLGYGSNGPSLIVPERV